MALKSDYISLLASGTYLATAYILVVAGVVVMVTGFLGCCATFKERRNLLRLVSRAWLALGGLGGPGGPPRLAVWGWPWGLDWGRRDRWDLSMTLQDGLCSAHLGGCPTAQPSCESPAPGETPAPEGSHRLLSGFLPLWPLGS